MWDSTLYNCTKKYRAHRPLFSSNSSVFYRPSGCCMPLWNLLFIFISPELFLGFLWFWFKNIAFMTRSGCMEARDTAEIRGYYELTVVRLYITLKYNAVGQRLAVYSHITIWSFFLVLHEVSLSRAAISVFSSSCCTPLWSLLFTVFSLSQVSLGLCSSM